MIFFLTFRSAKFVHNYSWQKIVEDRLRNFSKNVKTMAMTGGRMKIMKKTPFSSKSIFPFLSSQNFFA